METMKTGTTTVAIVAKDSIILAADKRATAGHLIAGKKVDKVQKVHERMALTTAGSVSDIQLLVKLIRAELKLKSLRNNRDVLVSEAANMIAGLVYGSIRRLTMIPGIVHFLFAGHDETGAYLYDIYPDGSITKIDDFVCSGSGGTFAFGVLDAQYKQSLTEEQATGLAVKAVNSALQRDSASGDGIDVYSINAEGVKQVYHKELFVSALK